MNVDNIGFQMIYYWPQLLGKKIDVAIQNQPAKVQEVKAITAKPSLSPAGKDQKEFCYHDLTKRSEQETSGSETGQTIDLMV